MTNSDVKLRTESFTEPRPSETVYAVEGMEEISVGFPACKQDNPILLDYIRLD